MDIPMSPHRSPIQPTYKLPINATTSPYPPLSPSHPTHQHLPPSIHTSPHPPRLAARSTTPPYPPPHQGHRKNASSGGNSATINSPYTSTFGGGSSNGGNGHRGSQHREIIGWHAADLGRDGVEGGMRERESMSKHVEVDKEAGVRERERERQTIIDSKTHTPRSHHPPSSSYRPTSSSSAQPLSGSHTMPSSNGYHSSHPPLIPSSSRSPHQSQSRSQNLPPISPSRSFYSESKINIPSNNSPSTFNKHARPGLAATPSRPGRPPVNVTANQGLIPVSTFNVSDKAPRISKIMDDTSALPSINTGRETSDIPHITAFPPVSAQAEPSSSTPNQINGEREPSVLGGNATAGPSNADVIMREAAEGFEKRRSKRGRETGDVNGTYNAGVSASGNQVKVGNVAKVGTGPGGVQRKKKKGDVDAPNQDFCSACKGIGKFLCCDGCPRSFHFMCLEPPLKIDELPEEETWYCKKCKQEKQLLSTPNSSKEGQLPRAELKPIPQTFRHLIKKLDDDNPSQFRLPQDVRQFFQGVASDNKGNYIEAEEVRTKYDRKGFQEERDGLKLKDAKSRPVACYVCGGSSIPSRRLTTDPGSVWRQIVSCDYCALHWHLDCLNPPLTSMPNSGRKWMCPNHADQIMDRKRTVRSGVAIVDIEQRNRVNNGNIIVIPSKTITNTMEYEDRMINKRKYKVPERIIQLDFWDRLKFGKGRKMVAPARKGMKRPGSESSLTSLETNDELEGLNANAEKSDLEVADFLIGLAGPSKGSRFNGAPKLPDEDNQMIVDGEADISSEHSKIAHIDPSLPNSYQRALNVTFIGGGYDHLTALSPKSHSLNSPSPRSRVSPRAGPSTNSTNSRRGSGGTRATNDDIIDELDESEEGDDTVSNSQNSRGAEVTNNSHNGQLRIRFNRDGTLSKKRGPKSDQGVLLKPGEEPNNENMSLPRIKLNVARALASQIKGELAD